MVKKSILNQIDKYLKALIKLGIPVQFGVLFGSYASNKNIHKWSDIDLLIISPRYDEPYTREDINILWKTAARIDSRIEPIPVGLRRWNTDDGSTIIEVARREGKQIEVKGSDLEI